MNLQEVTTPQHEKLFVKMAISHYKGCKNWIRPIDQDIYNVFDKKKNKLFRDQKANAMRWLLMDNGKIIGRIAAFIHPKTSFRGSMNVGGIGFFECVDDQEAANLMFNASVEWLKAQGMEAIDGPINFGERNAFWGLLVHGFDIEPVYQMNYNYDYYQKLFEDFGFQLYFKQFSYGLPLFIDRPKKYQERAAIIRSNPRYSFRHVEKDKLDQYADDFYEIYNKAWSGHKGVPALSRKQAQMMMKKMKPMIVDYLMWFAYYDNEPAAMYINLPELNQYFKHVNGKIDLLGKLKILYHKLAKTNRKFYGIVFGVIPEQQAKGLDSAIIMAADDHIKQYPQWQDIELTWIGDFNPKMMRIAENLGSDVIKTHHTYRYLFDRNAEFERHPIIG
ncbi:MAG: hypothetical protein HKN92_07275 [Chitinophagales bacterium]|nr:hypothetical protein [Chitinophagales bacterium]